MGSYDPLEFPVELYSKPSALIGLCGLDVQNNALHRRIWELFNLTEERFKLFSINHNFPPVKPKRTSYEWYIPKGLLKRNWMRKRLSEIPAVVALMFDWDDANHEQLKVECAAQVRALRASLGNHNTKIVVILIQKVAPLPDDAKASEKAKSLCAACDIEIKQLFTLPHGDHLEGCIVRLENALRELVQNYYHHEIKLIKQHRDQLNKATQQYLFVRHHFKLGFLSELKRDYPNAKKYYDLAYGYLKELRISDTNIVEVKLVAGFIIYKLCYLMFGLKLARDAITHFKLHIECYKNKTGSLELTFEHYSWLSKQYSAFGDIFDDAVKQGLEPVQTQHPGFYYRLAAKYAIDRKNACLKLCKDITTYPSSDPLLGLNNLEFYGQRPWRPGQLSAEPINSSLELEGITALKYKEKLVNHSGIIISLLGSAISQFKAYKCPRMRLELVVKMADEYFYSKDYGKALTLFSHILWDYKDEKWWLLLSTLLSRALSCAYMAASVKDYIIFAVEALGPLARFDLDTRRRVFNNLVAVLQMKNPDPEPEILAQNVPQADSLWTATTRSDQSQSITVEMSNPKSCIEAKARFTKPTFGMDKIITVDVLIRSSCPYPVELSHVSVGVNSQNYSSEFSASSENLLLEPGVVKKLVCEFKCSPTDVGRSIQIGSISLTMGAANERCAILKYTVTPEQAEEIKIEKPTDEFQFFRLSISDPLFDRIENSGTAKITPAESKVKVAVTHDSPALLSEWYPMKVNVLNEDDFKITDAHLEIKLLSTHKDSTVEETTQLCFDVKNPTLQNTPALNLSLKDIPQNESESVTIYLKGNRVGDRTLAVNLNYSLVKSSGPPNKSFINTVVKVPVIQPFEVTAEILSMKFEQMDICWAKYPFILRTMIRILSPQRIRIHQTTLEPGLMFRPCDEVITSHLAGTVLKEGECGVDMFPLLVEEPSEQPLALGMYMVEWSRADSSETTSSSVTMPTVICEPTIVGVAINLPAFGWVRKPMKVEYSLCNHTNNLLQLDVFMEASDAFTFSGQKQLQLRLLPGSVKKLEYNLYPLLSGLVALPRLVFRTPTEEFMEQLNQVIDRHLSSHVYVMPQEKLPISTDDTSQTAAV